jgi:putative hydrolase of the HAD superfamily
MSTPYVEIFRKHARPMEPIPTGQTPVLKPLPGVRAVLFDLYGTLLASGSGEVGAEATGADVALAEALRVLGIQPRGPFDKGASCLFDTIEAMHADARATGRDYPEVDVVEVWRRAMAELGRRGLIDPAAGESVDFARLAVEYEARANPSWPMPGLRECLEALRCKGLLLGLMSNAQFYTPALFEALLGCPPEAFGFDRRLQYYSYQYGWGKPSPRLFELAAEALAARTVAPGEVVFVGNDMLNDVLPARRVGFRAALFAGDARSLRLRQGDPRVEGVAADVILTELGQIVECILT